MAELKYVCLSDFHLGAVYSILTNFDVKLGKVDTTKSSQSLSAFAEALHQYLPPICGTELPTLILMGDVLDLSFSDMHTTVDAFQQFVEMVFPKDKPPLFQKKILFLPGNHDHHLWESEKDRFFVQQLERFRASKAVPNIKEVTRLVNPPQINSYLLTTVIQSYDHLKDFEISIAYPNLGFVNKDRMVLLHHGHFIESAYRLMTTIGDWIFDNKFQKQTVENIEKVNGSWIDFAWSTLGTSGEIGTDTIKFYDLMQDGAALHQFLGNLAQKIADELLPYLPSNGLPKVHEYSVEAIRGLLDVIIERGAELERNSYLEVLSQGSFEGLKWYLNNPIYEQLLDDVGDSWPDDISFIFGHTHKPFEDELPLEKYKLPVKIYNTGGWVLDVPKMVRPQGSAMVLIDENLQIASLRLFNDPVNGVMPPVEIKGTGGYPDENNSFLKEMERYQAENESIWDAFSNAALQEIAERAFFLQKKFFNPKGEGIPK